jgi:hypothetical protein
MSEADTDAKPIETKTTEKADDETEQQAADKKVKLG